MPRLEPRPSALRRARLGSETAEFAESIVHLVRAGDAGRLRPLLERGVDPNLANDRGDTLLLLAAYHGQLEVAAQLLEHGAHPDTANTRGQTPLAGAAFKGDLDVVQALLDGGAQVDAQGPDGRTALFTAAMFDRLAVLRLLLGHGADLHHRDAVGLNAREAAQKMGAEDAAELLAAAVRAQAASA